MPHSDLTNLDDEELMLRVRDGADDAAFTQLVDRFSPGLAHYLSRIAGGSSADDLVQSTFLQAHLHRGQYQPGRKVRPWLYGIATHLAIDRWRRSKRELSLDAITPAGENARDSTLAIVLPSETVMPDQFARDRDTYEALHAAVDSLPDHLHSVVVLVDLQGLKYAEAADLLEIPIGTVKSRLNAARRLLRQKVHRQDVDEEFTTPAM